MKKKVQLNNESNNNNDKKMKLSNKEHSDMDYKKSKNSRNTKPNLELIKERIKNNFYDSDFVIETVVDKILCELSN